MKGSRSALAEEENACDAGYLIAETVFTESTAKEPRCPCNRSREFGGYSKGIYSKEPNVALEIQAVLYGGYSTEIIYERFFRCPENPSCNVWGGGFYRSTGIFITEVLIYNQSKPPVQTLEYIVCTGSQRPTSSTGEKTVTLLCNKTFT